MPSTATTRWPVTPQDFTDHWIIPHDPIPK
jgi:hypothetical protein